MKLFRYFLFVFSFVSIAAVSQAAVNTPKDSRGESLDTIDWVGAIPCEIDAATGTANVLCFSGRAVVYGIIASSITATNYLVFRDTATTNLTSATHTVVYADNGENDEGGGLSLTIKFPAPLRFLNGISINASAAPQPSAVARWTIYYRPMSATE